MGRPAPPSAVTLPFLLHSNLMMVLRLLLPCLCAALISVAAPATKPVVPEGVKPVGPYTPGLDAGDLVYVSGQGARDLKGALPPTFEAQVRQCLENVKGVLAAAGLGMENVVYTQSYLLDMKQMATFTKVWQQYFKSNPPAGSLIGVQRMPTDTPVEVAAVAVRNLGDKKVLGPAWDGLQSTAVMVKDRVYLSGGVGREALAAVRAKAPAAQLKVQMNETEKVLKQAGMEMRHLVYANVYVTNKLPMPVLVKALEEYIPDETATTVIQTASLPGGADLQVSGVASRDIKRLGHCASIGPTAYCAGRGGTIQQALSAIKADLEVNKMSMSDVVAANL